MIEETPCFENDNNEYTTCFAGKTVYVKTDFLYFCENKEKWFCIKDIPFTKRKGQSMTACDDTIAFFGGVDESGEYFDDFWLYRDNEWFEIASNIPERAFHAACYIGDNKILITGGHDSDNYYDDFYVLNIITGDSTRLDIKNTVKRSHHSATYVDDETIYIVGGYDKDKEDFCSDVFVLSLKERTLTLLTVTFSIPGFGSHSVSFLPGNLIIAPCKLNNFPPSNLWFFNINKRLWIPHFYETSVALTYTEGVVLMFVERETLKITSLRMFPLKEVGQPTQTIEYQSYMEKVLACSMDLIDSVQEDNATEKNLMLMTKRLFRKCSTIKLVELKDYNIEPMDKKLEEISRLLDEYSSESSKAEMSLNTLINKLESKTEKILIKAKHLSNVEIDYSHLVNDTKQASLFLKLTHDSIERELPNFTEIQTQTRKKKCEILKILSDISNESVKIRSLKNSMTKANIKMIHDVRKLMDKRIEALNYDFDKKVNEKLNKAVVAKSRTNLVQNTNEKYNYIKQQLSQAVKENDASMVRAYIDQLRNWLNDSSKVLFKLDVETEAVPFTGDIKDKEDIIRNAMSYVSEIESLFQ